MERLTDADALLKRMCELCGENCEMPNEAVQCIEWEFAHDAIESLPPVDAVEVVRCKDCKWQITAYCPMPSWERKDNHYCYKGEREEDAKTD